MITMPIRMRFLFFGFAAGASIDFGVVSIFFPLELRWARCFWDKGCFRHLHTDNQDNSRGCNRLNMGVDKRYPESRLDGGLMSVFPPVFKSWRGPIQDKIDNTLETNFDRKEANQIIKYM